MNAIPKPPALFASQGLSTAPPMGAVAWLGQLFFAPGDRLIYAVAAHAPKLAALLQLSSTDYGGVFSGIVSAMAWLAAFVVVGTVYGAVRDFDRALTQRIARLYEDGRARLRIGINLAAYRLRHLRGEHLPQRRKEPVLELTEEVEVSVAELKVLHVHSNLRPGFALPLSDIATAVGLGKTEVQRLLTRLRKLNLLATAFGGADDESTYALTPAGRAFLLFRQLAARDARPSTHGGHARRPPQL